MAKQTSGEEEAVRRAFDPIIASFGTAAAAELADQLNQASVVAYNMGGQHGMDTILFGGSFNLRDPGILEQLRNRANMLAGGVLDSEFEAMKRVIGKAVYDDGLGPPEIARQLRKRFDYLTLVRSRAIARTETLVAMESSQNEVFLRSGVVAKRWLARLDDRTRTDHRNLHNQVVPINQPFVVGGTTIRFPGDPTAPAKQIVNCRCATAAAEIPNIAGPATLWDGGSPAMEVVERAVV